MTAIARATPRAPIAWRRALGYALLWGLALSVIESFDLPLGELTLREFLGFTIREP